MAEALLSLQRVSKSFRSHWTFQATRAVQGVSLDVFPAETLGFLGHNGAGKTTTIKCILGLIRVNSGRILLEGKEIKTSQQRGTIGYLPEQPYFYDHLSVEETMDFFASLLDIPSKEKKLRIEETLELVYLADRKKAYVRALSKGLQQRLGLAQAILNRPRLLLLDEPFSGLDPIGRRQVRDLLLELRRQGTTIFLSSHILSDVNDICDRVAVMAKGELKSVFELRDIPKLFGEAFEIKISATDASLALIERIQKQAISSQCLQTTHETMHSLRFEEYPLAEEALQELSQANVRITSFESVGLSLEDIFMKITEESKDPVSGENRNETELP